MDISPPHEVQKSEKKEYTGVASRLMKLLGNGCSQEEASRALGIDASYTSQLMAETDFREQVNLLVTKAFAEQSVIDENYTKIEKKLSDRLLSVSDSVYSPDQILRVLKFANEAKRKVLPQSSGGQGQISKDGTTIVVAPVTLILPSTVAKEYIVNPQNEVVGINGKELTTLPSANLTAVVAQNKDNLKQKHLLEKKNGSGKTDPYSDL